MSAALKIAHLRGLRTNRHDNTGRLSKPQKKISRGEEVLTKDEKAYMVKNLSKDELKDMKDLGFDFQMAMRQDELDRGISNEYFDFIQQGNQVVKEFSDGEITMEDMSHKTEFLSHLDEREACMRRCLHLIGDSNHPKAQEMRLRWQRLLITRQAIKSATDGKKVSDKPIDKEYANRLMGAVNKKLASREFNPFLRARLEMENSSKDAEIRKEVRKQGKETPREKLARLRGTLSKSEKSSKQSDKQININNRMQNNGFDLARFNQMREGRTA